MFDKKKNFFGGHGIVGNQIPIGAGIAFSEKYKKTDNVCITFLGDGAVRIGAFHEALNISMFLKLPVIFIIENNGYAMGTSVKRSSNVTELFKLGLGYDIPSKPVDAMNVINVHHAVSKAANRARNGKGPSLLEFRTYRYKGHSMSDPAQYRSKKELENYKQKDPIEQVKNLLLSKNILSINEIELVDKNIKEQIKKSVDFAEKSPYPNKEEVFSDIYVQKDYPFIKE
jgi:pyruvate dehydrogenase E1 component alpha subunit